MKLTKKNYESVVPKNEQKLLGVLIMDLEDINKYHENNIMYIDWQDYHDEYSSERTEPCPDFYGYYTLRFEKVPNEIVGSKMTISELDDALFLLYCYNSISESIEV